MLKLLPRSLLMRLGVAMATITALAVLGMVSSVLLAELMKGDAGAINQAGSLRMQIYRIGTRLADPPHQDGLRAAMQEFESRLASPKLFDALPQRRGAELRTAYERIVQRWRLEVEPLLAGVQRNAPGDAGAHEARQARILPVLDQFVVEVDQLVELLEGEAEAKIFLLRVIQGVALFCTLVVVYLTMRLMHKRVQTPLRDLLRCAERTRRGDFSARARHTGNDELGQLGTALNAMATDLSASYADLEQRVASKTADLERSNRSLELLYNTIRRLNEAPASEETYRALLKDIEKAIGIGAGTICTSDGGGGRIFEVTSSGTARTRINPCRSAECSPCAADPRTCAQHLLGEGFERDHALAVSLRDREQSYGVLLLDVPAGATLEPWQAQLVEAVGRHVGIAIGTTRRAVQGRRLALLEERAVIARELHDSLAQSLSYLKIQVTRLQPLLGRYGDTGDIDAVVGELREGLSSAYRQLRELLTTFRLQMDGRGLGPALTQTVEELAERSGVHITLENDLRGCPLSANEEIHVLQIIREALSNVVRHAQARRATVHLRYDPGGAVTVRVDDDGVGIQAQEDPMHHHGLVIMQERAHGLGGVIQARRRPEGGTRVELRFEPALDRARTTSARSAAAL